MKDIPYKYGFSSIPWQLLDMLSANAYKAFGKIHQCVFMNCRDQRDGVEIPTALFERAVATHYVTIKKAIAELEEYGLITISKSNRKKVLYYINWEEIELLHTQLAPLNGDGRDAIFKLLRQQHTSLSKLPENDYFKICSNPALLQKMKENELITSENEVKNQNGTQGNAVLLQKMKENGFTSENEVTISSDLECDVEKIDDKTFLLHFLKEHYFRICSKNDFLLHFLNTDNIEKEKDKELSEARSDSYIKGENIFSSSETVEEVDEDSEEEIERRSQERRKRKLEHNKARSSKSPDNPYEKKPYFPRTVLEEFVDNPELCKDSPVKMYIYNLFKGLSDYCCNIREEQEDDEELPSDEKYIPSFEDLQSTLYPVATINQIAKTAYDDTVGLSQVGEFEDEYGSFQISFTEVPDLDTAHICDWKFTESRQYVQISTSAFRNIEAEDLQDLSDMKEKDSQSNIREAVRNRQYYGYLLLADKNSLTTIEQLQSDFLQTYVVFDEYYHAVGCKNNTGELMETGLTLPWQTFSSFMAKLIEADVEPKQFFGTLTMRDSWLRGMDIKIGSGVFSYYSTQKLNQQLSLNSEVTMERLDECFPVE